MLWDLRKLKAVQTFDIGSPVNAVRFDNSGMYFGVASQDIKYLNIDLPTLILQDFLQC